MENSEDRILKQKEFFDIVAKLHDQIDLSGVRSASSEFGEERELRVPMRDGIGLRTIIYFPAGNGPWPVLFSRTPYLMDGMIRRREAEEYVKRGYAYIIQYCRGSAGSDGEWVPNENERNDGFDGINWVAKQEWCGPIGIHGMSYSALTGWIIADQLPEKVKALYLSHYSVDRYLSAYKAGLFRHDILTSWAMGNMGNGQTGGNPDHIESSLYRPHINVDEDVWGVRLDWYRQWITNVEYASEYWNTGVWKTLREIPEHIKIPVCIIAGWYDHHLEGTILGYEKLNDKTKAHSKLLIGAWNHYMLPCVPAHDPQNAALKTFEHKFNWFDGILVDGIQPETGVESYIIGDDSWHKWETWPILSHEKKNLYLNAKDDSDSKAYTLSLKQAEPFTIEYEYDPANPVYSYGGETLLASVDRLGSLKQEDPGYREDIISFVSQPLSEDLIIAGKIYVRLFVSSDCEDTCFSAKIMEVLPNGDAYNIRSSITTLAFRNYSPSRIKYIPGDVVEANIDLLPVTWKIKKGSSIRVDISSSDFPEYSVHTNYAGIWSLQDKTKTAHQKIYCSKMYPSTVEIPYI